MFKIELNNIVKNNEKLSEIQKLHYINAALENEVKRIETVEDTFAALLKALENGFEIKRTIVNIHLKCIIVSEKITPESFYESRRLVDATNKNIKALKNLI